MAKDPADRGRMAGMQDSESHVQRGKFGVTSSVVSLSWEWEESCTSGQPQCSDRLGRMDNAGEERWRDLDSDRDRHHDAHDHNDPFTSTNT
eukprot:2456617-Rhodomonas_salina.1